jgi:5-methylcytosine-specific restriction endonuclease McrA
LLRLVAVAGHHRFRPPLERPTTHMDKRDSMRGATPSEESAYVARLTTLKSRVKPIGSRLPRTAEPARISGRRLQQIRERVLRADPLCVECRLQGRVTLATQVDHIVALVNGGNDDPHDDSNRQGLCEDCHSTKTVRDVAEAKGGGWLKV